MIAAGKLRHRVSLQRYVTTRDPDTGDVIQDWAEVAKIWASIEPLSVREFNAAAASQSKVTTRIQIRYRDDVDHTMRIVHMKRSVAKIYNIEGVLPDKDSGLEYITLAASEGVNNG